MCAEQVQALGCSKGRQGDAPSTAKPSLPYQLASTANTHAPPLPFIAARYPWPLLRPLLTFQLERVFREYEAAEAVEVRVCGDGGGGAATGEWRPHGATGACNSGSGSEGGVGLCG